jgi:tetratricopeptide (TPR) repeat protein
MLKTKMLALLLIALLIPAAVLAQPNPEFRAGTEAFYQGDMKTAISMWEQALNSGKLDKINQGLAHMNIGLAYTQMGNTQMAEKHLDLAIKADPRQPMFQASRGDLSYLRGQLDQAVGFYSKALMLNGDYFPALLNRGIVFSKQKKYEAALKDFNKCVQIGDAPFQVYNAMGNCYEAMGKQTEAVSQFSKSIIANPKYPSPYFNRSRVYEKMGYVDKALEDAEKFAMLSPGHPWADKRIQDLKAKKAADKKKD